ncbi:MAG TPA: CYTH domain-containing protein [Bacillota bacterium]|nr:CYTH domain-containing protein [Bacillota bacterium]
MRKEIEYESKNLLTEEEFFTLLQAYEFPTEKIEQTNYYFDTAKKHLHKNKCALRIRLINKQYTLTYKEPYRDGTLELHETLSKADAEKWLNNNFNQTNKIVSHLKQNNFPINQLNYLGELTTTRFQLAREHVTLFLDKSSYNNQQDFEIEVEAESSSMAHSFLIDILNTYHIRKRDAVPKIIRFLETR